MVDFAESAIDGDNGAGTGISKSRSTAAPMHRLAGNASVLIKRAPRYGHRPGYQRLLVTGRLAAAACMPLLQATARLREGLGKDPE